MRARALLLALLALPCACSGADEGLPPRGTTGLLLEVDVEASLRREGERLRVEVATARPDGWMQRPAVELDLRAAGGELDWPKRGAIEPAGDRVDAQVRVRVVLLGEGEASPLVAAEASTRFVPGQWRILRVTLAEACRGVWCAEGWSCAPARGACEPSERPPQELELFAAEPGFESADAGAGE